MLGGLSTSRINTDIREEKNWAYGAFAGISDGKGQLYSLIYAPVQTDRTADSIKAIQAGPCSLRVAISRRMTPCSLPCRSPWMSRPDWISPM